jgi:2-C-methyl-D-erythritol 4-phosphate cytidylyltransferase
MKKNGVILVAAGSGSRLKSRIPKSLVKIRSWEMFLFSLAVFQFCDDFIHEIALVVPDGRAGDFTMASKKAGLSYDCRIVNGGRQRQDSVRNGLLALPKEIEHVMIHDAARPFITPAQLKVFYRLLKKHGAATMAAPVRDTLRMSETEGKQGFLTKQVDRENLWALGTPQGFIFNEILEAHERLHRSGRSVSDDTALITKRKIAVMETDFLNFKITYPADLIIADQIADLWLSRVAGEGLKIHF